MPVVLVVPELGALVIALVAIALALLIVDIMRHVGDLVRPIWLVGSTIADGVEALAQAIAGVLGKAERGVDAAIGASWHVLTSFLDETWKLVRESATGYMLLAELVARLVYAHSGLKAIVHLATAAVHGIEHGVRDLTRVWHGIEHRVRDLERAVTVGIGHDLRIGLRDLRNAFRGIDETVTVTIPKEIAHVEGEVASLGRFVGAVPGTSYLEWAKGLALAGLAALGLKGLACENNPLKGKDCSSNVWGDLESLLFGAAVFGITVNLAEIIDAAVQVEQEALGAITALVSIDSSVVQDAAQIVAAATNAVAT